MSAVATPGSKVYLSNSFPNNAYLLCEGPDRDFKKASDASKKGVPVSFRMNSSTSVFETVGFSRKPRDSALPIRLFNFCRPNNSSLVRSKAFCVSKFCPDSLETSVGSVSSG